MKKLVSEELTTPSPTRRRAEGASATDAEDPEARRLDTVHQDAGSDDDDDDDDEGDTLAADDDESAQSLDALEEQFHLLEEEVATLVADVHDLALYTKLNITGFMKILKVRTFVRVCVVITLIHWPPPIRNTMYVTTLYPCLYPPLTWPTLLAETNPNSPHADFHPELSRETSLLQV